MISHPDAKPLPPPEASNAIDDHPALAAGARISLAGLLLNVTLAVGKLVAGVLGHSFALVADAAESSLDVVASFVVWHGLRIAGRPADDDHPYGHGRAEALSGMIVAMIILLAGVGIGILAIRGLFQPHPGPAPFTLVVLLAIVITKETMYHVTARTARRINSSAVRVDAWHHRSDAVTSAAAAVGVSIALIGGPAYAQADNWAALVAAGIIIINSFRLVRPPLHDLMDTHPPEIVDQARSLARSVVGVAGVEKTLARKSGLDYWVDMHVEVDPEMTVQHAHAVAHNVKDAIREAMPNVRDVLVHIEPHHHPPPAAE